MRYAGKNYVVLGHMLNLRLVADEQYLRITYGPM